MLTHVKPVVPPHRQVWTVPYPTPLNCSRGIETTARPFSDYLPRKLLLVRKWQRSISQRSPLDNNESNMTSFTATGPPLLPIYDCYCDRLNTERSLVQNLKPRTIAPILSRSTLQRHSFSGPVCVCLPTVVPFSEMLNFNRKYLTTIIFDSFLHLTTSF